MTVSVSTRAPIALPALSLATIGLMILSGSVATVAFDIWGQSIARWLGIGALAPEGLARGLLGTLGLPNKAAEGKFMHLFVVGLIAYPAGYLFVFRPLWERFVGLTHWFVPSAIYGIGLWVVAIGGVTAIAGMPFFLGFTTITWNALVGHVIYGVALGAVIAHQESRPA